MHWLQSDRFRSKTNNMLIFILVFSLTLIGFYTLNKNRIAENEALIEEAFHALIISEANGLSNGYFQWDDMMNAIEGDDAELLEQFEHEIGSIFAFADSLKIIEKSFDGKHLYSFHYQDASLYIDFGVYDSYHENFLQNKVVRFNIAPQSIFDQIFVNQDSKYIVSVIDRPDIEAIQITNSEQPIKIFHFISAGSFALLVLLLIQAFRHLSVTSHYEIEGLSNIVMMLSKKDSYTAEHSVAVANIAVFIASQLGFTAKQKRTLFKAGQLHDIGKIGVSESILNKPGKLTDEEYEEIKKHSVVGYDIVSHFPNLKEVALIVRHHHELLDGSGYPDGLKGDEIPFMSQILSVADIYNALTTDRPYRKGFESERAFQIMAEMPVNQELVSILAAYTNENHSHAALG